MSVATVEKRGTSSSPGNEIREIEKATQRERTIVVLKDPHGCSVKRRLWEDQHGSKETALKCRDHARCQLLPGLLTSQGVGWGTWPFDWTVAIEWDVYPKH